MVSRSFLHETTIVHIEQAFLTLMREIPFDQIHVSDVIKRSGLGRATFYRYFKNTMDILNNILHRIWQSIEKTVNEMPSDIEFLDFASNLLFVIYNFRDELKIIWGENGSGGQYLRWYGLYKPWIMQYLSQAPKNRHIPIDYEIDYIVGNMVNLQMMWLKQPIPESPMQFSNVFRATFKTSMRDLI
ncbi:MAG TPA: TetR/AcrR family transcriptional regulator [Lactobacillaceae bacterium]|jgi:AcrR family transcriptional regulator